MSWFYCLYLVPIPILYYIFYCPILRYINIPRYYLYLVEHSWYVCLPSQEYSSFVGVGTFNLLYMLLILQVRTWFWTRLKIMAGLHTIAYINNTFPQEKNLFLGCLPETCHSTESWWGKLNYYHSSYDRNITTPNHQNIFCSFHIHQVNTQMNF